MAAPEPESADAWIRQQVHDHRILERAMRQYVMRADGSVDGTLYGPTGLDADLLVPDYEEVAATWLQQREGSSGASPESDEEAAQEDVLRAINNDFDAAQLW
jgi:hypothetical protein